MKLHTFCNDNLRHRLMALQSNTALCDFTFKLHDSTQFSTHKAVVAAFSTTALMLCDETGQVVIPRHDITRDIFQIVLNFIYGQSIVVKDTYMKQLEWLANYLGIEDLSKVLVPFKSLTSNSDVCIEIKEEPIELNDELDVQESTSAMLHNAVFSDTYADDNDIKDEDNEHSAIFTKQRQKRHKTSKGKAKTKSSKKRKTNDTDNANKELADDKNDDTDIDNEDDINDEMDTGESASNEINDNIENVTTKQEPADSGSEAPCVETKNPLDDTVHYADELVEIKKEPSDPTPTLEMSELTGDVSELTGDVSERTGDVSERTGDVSERTGDVSELTGDVSESTGDVSELKGNKQELFKNTSPAFPERMEDSPELLQSTPVPETFKHSGYSQELLQNTSKSGDIKQFRCAYPECGMKFSRKFNLNRHHKKCHLEIKQELLQNTPISGGRKILRCLNPECGKIFSSKFNLKRHLKKFHSELKEINQELFQNTTKSGRIKTFKQELSENTSADLPELVKDSQELFPNTLTPKKSELSGGKQKLFQNTGKSRRKGILKCANPKCEKKFSSKFNLKRHLKRFHPELKEIKQELFQNTTTSKKSSGDTQKLFQNTLNSGKIILRCANPECGKKFSSKFNLKRHQKRFHVSDDGFHPESERKSSSKFNLNKHQKGFPVCDEIMGSRQEITIKKSDKILCELCATPISQMSGYRKHMKSKHGMGLFTCDICKRQFVGKGALSEHISLVHVGVDPFLCEQPDCGKCFSNEFSLKRHQKRYHSLYDECSDTPFHCAALSCGKSFSTRFNLNRHQRNQHGIHDIDEYSDAVKKEEEPEITAADVE